MEDYFHVAALAPAIPRGSWSARQSRVDGNTERLLDILDARAIRGTFFVLGWVAERHPDLVRRIAGAGHEVACHGFSHELIYRQSPDTFREETRRAKSLIEEAARRPVIGYRAASFSITRDSLWALDVLIDLGFAYDSSIFPIRHDRYGIPDAATRPGRVTAPSGRTLVEFPLSAASFLGLKVPVSGGGYFRIFPYWVCELGLRQVNSRRGPFAFYVHPWEIDPHQPRVAAGALARWRHYTGLERCERRLERLLGEFRFGRMADVLTGSGLLPSSSKASQ